MKLGLSDVLRSHLLPVAAAVVLITAGAVEIAEAQNAMPLARWQISSTPVAVIRDDGTQRTQWSRLVGALRLSNGDLLIGDAGTGVHRFTTNGEYVKLELRLGNGPRELPDLTGLTAWGSGGVATSSNEFVTLGVSTPRKGGFLAGGGPPIGSLNAVFLDGSVLQVRSRTMLLTPPTRVVRDSVTVVLRSASGGVDTVARALGSTGLVLESSALSYGIGYRLIEGAPQLRVTGRDSVAWIGSTEESTVSQVILRKGTTDQRMRIPLPLARTEWSAGRRAAWATWSLNSTDQPDARAMVQATWARDVLPPHMPRFRSLVSDVDGGLWVEQFPEQPSLPPTFLVLSNIGKALARVSLARPGRVLHVDAAYVVVAERDEDDVESVAVYALERRR